jgi:hypothetical protein
LSTFLDRDLVELSIDRGVLSRPPQRGTRYCAYADLSGGRHDATCAAIAHRVGDTVYLDHLFEAIGPHDPLAAIEAIANLCRRYNLDRISGDEYSYNLTESAFRRSGILYEPTRHDRSTIYLNALPVFVSNRVRLIDHSRLANQLLSLERRVLKSGRTLIDHPSHASDDAAVAAAGALWMAATANLEPAGIYTYYMDQVRVREAPPTPVREARVRIRRPAHQPGLNLIYPLGDADHPIVVDADGCAEVPRSCLKDFVLAGWTRVEPELEKT